jgi:hypothetical protein
MGHLGVWVVFLVAGFSVVGADLSPREKLKFQSQRYEEIYPEGPLGLESGTIEVDGKRVPAKWAYRGPKGTPKTALDLIVVHTGQRARTVAAAYEVCKKYSKEVPFRLPGASAVLVFGAEYIQKFPKNSEEKDRFAYFYWAAPEKDIIRKVDALILAVDGSGGAGEEASLVELLKDMQDSAPQATTTEDRKLLESMIADLQKGVFVICVAGSEEAKR